MYDAALVFGKKLDQTSSLYLSHITKGGILATVHRQENTEDPRRLMAIFEGLAEVAKHHPVIVPLHPRTRKALDQQSLTSLLDPFHVIDPVGYFDMVALQRASSVIVTDSGGIQKEAFFHKVPCV